jgi:phosphate transport system substrate-binding protein
LSTISIGYIYFDKFGEYLYYIKLKRFSMYKFRTVLLLVIVVIFSLQCSSPDSKRALRKKSDLKGKISISGAFALYPMTAKWAEEFQKVYPEIKIDISAGGAGKGMTDVLAGMVDLAMFSREVNKAEIDKGAWYIAVTKDAVLPTISSQNPALSGILSKGFTQEIFKEIYLSGNTHTWGEFVDLPESSKINVYTRSDACGAAEMWGKYLGKNQESLLGVGVYGDPGIADAVKNDQFGIGYNNVIYAYDIKTRTKYAGMEVIPIDLNGNRIIDPEENFYNSLDSIMHAIQTNKYPSPPARDLYLVSKGKPDDRIILTFLEWILTDGQQYVHEGGYVNLPGEQIKQELQKLK